MKTERNKQADIRDGAEAEAISWFSRRDRGLTADENEAFQRWLAADQRHFDAVARMTRMWGMFDQLQDSARSGAQPDPDALAPSSSRKWAYPSLLAAAAAVALVFVFVRRGPVTRPFEMYSTAPGQFESVSLEDGSVAKLNGDTAVAVTFVPAERRVRLDRGEAHFQVAKNPARPFVVSANGVSVYAVGTAFDVRFESGAIDVLVTEGKVRVEQGFVSASGAVAAPRFLVAGQRIAISTGEHPPAPVVAAISPDEEEQTLSWQLHPLDFRQTPLSQVVAEFNRCNHCQIAIRDPELAQLHIGGTFDAGNEAGFLRLLEGSFGIAVERVSPSQVVLRKVR